MPAQKKRKIVVGHQRSKKGQGINRNVLSHVLSLPDLCSLFPLLQFSETPGQRDLENLLYILYGGINGVKRKGNKSVLRSMLLAFGVDYSNIEVSPFFLLGFDSTRTEAGLWRAKVLAMQPFIEKAIRHHNNAVRKMSEEKPDDTRLAADQGKLYALVKRFCKKVNENEEETLIRTDPADVLAHGLQYPRRPGAHVGAGAGAGAAGAAGAAAGAAADAGAYAAPVIAAVAVGEDAYAASASASASASAAGDRAYAAPAICAGVGRKKRKRAGGVKGAGAGASTGVRTRSETKEISPSGRGMGAGAGAPLPAVAVAGAHTAAPPAMPPPRLGRELSLGNFDFDDFDGSALRFLNQQDSTPRKSSR
jgi:hypothetical protein